jgi:hypothetical protein
MSFWNFAKGAADTLIRQREQEGAEQRELEMWKQRFDFQQKIQQQMEEQKAKNRIIAEGVDTKSGEMYSVTAGGQETRTKAPEALLRQQQAAEQAALDKAARDQRKFEADVMSKGASAEAAKASAQASLASIARLEGRAKSQNAVDQARTKYYEQGGSRGKPEEKAAKEAATKINAIAADISRLKDDEAIARAMAIKNSGRPPEEVIADLQQLLLIAAQK